MMVVIDVVCLTINEVDNNYATLRVLRGDGMFKNLGG